jgi:GTP-binding protein
MKSDNPLRPARYLKSVHELHQLPADDGAEVAICGRSNAGKSTAINSICDHTRLARTSKTPGRTQQLVYFEVQPDRYLVDLPGYGYAKVPDAVREHWQGLLEAYFVRRQSLRGLLLVMDIRHPLKDYDQQMLAFAAARALPAHVLLSKADKLARGARSKTLLEVRRALGERATVQLFSGPEGLGLEEAREQLIDWLDLPVPVTEPA